MFTTTSYKVIKKVFHTINLSMQSLLLNFVVNRVCKKIFTKADSTFTLTLT